MILPFYVECKHLMKRTDGCDPFSAGPVSDRSDGWWWYQKVKSEPSANVMSSNKYFLMRTSLFSEKRL